MSFVAKIGYIPQFKASNARDQDEVSSDLARMELIKLKKKGGGGFTAAQTRTALIWEPPPPGGHVGLLLTGFCWIWSGRKPREDCFPRG